MPKLYLFGIKVNYKLFILQELKMKNIIKFFIVILVTFNSLFSLAVQVDEWRTRKAATRSDDPELNVQLGAWFKEKFDQDIEPKICISGLRWGTEETSLKSNDLIIGQFASSGATSVDIVYRSNDFKEGDKLYCYEGRISAGVQLVGLGRDPHCSQCPRHTHWNKGTTLNSRDLRVSDLCMFYIPFPRDPKFHGFKIVDVLVNGESVPFIVKFNTQPALTRVGTKVPRPPKVTFHSGSITKVKKEIIVKKENPNDFSSNNIRSETSNQSSSNRRENTEQSLFFNSFNLVRLPNGLYMGKYEVTQKQWETIMGTNPSRNKGENLPVDNVSWNDVQIFLQKINNNPHVKNSGMVFRLPTYREWGYACLAGSTGAYGRLSNGSVGGVDDFAWYRDNSNGESHLVGTKSPNAWGLYDMHGNLWEFTSTLSEDSVVTAGGCWAGSHNSCTVKSTAKSKKNNSNITTGFRIVVSKK